MGDSDDSQTSSENSLFSDAEPDLVALFQIIIRNRNRMRLDVREWCLGDIGSSSRNELEAPEFRDRDQPSTSKEDTDRLLKLEKSMFKQDTLMMSGEFEKAHKRTGPTCSMLFKRETGMPENQSFSRSDRCYISSRYLPNKSSIFHLFQYKAFCGTHSADGSLFLTASQDCKIRIYDAERDVYKKLKMIEARDVGWSVLDTAISPDGRYMAYSSWSECIHLCNIHGSTDIHESLPLSPDDRRFCVFSIAFSSDGHKILGGANDGALYMYDIEHRKVTRIASHEDDINAVAFADSTSQILYSGSDDGLCKVWDTRVLNESKPIPVGILSGHRAGITYIDPRGDGRHLITNSKDQTIKLWDMRLFSPQTQIKPVKLPGPSWDYRCDRVPKRYSCLPLKTLRNDTSVMTYAGHRVLRTLIRCHFSPAFTTGQRYIYTGCASGAVIVYDALTGAIVSKLSNHKDCVRDVSWHPYKSEIASTSWDRCIRLWKYQEIDSSDDEFLGIEGGRVAVKRKLESTLRGLKNRQ